MAIRGHVPLEILSDTIQPFPTFSEIYINALKALRDEIAVASKPVGAVHYLADGELGLSLPGASGCPSSTLGRGGMAEPTTLVESSAMASITSSRRNPERPLPPLLPSEAAEAPGRGRSPRSRPGLSPDRELFPG